MKYRFLNFELDVGNRELLFEGRSVRLSALNFTLLQVLVENPGKVFSREELIERVWPARIVTQNSLDQSLSLVRKTLATRTIALCIETVYGKGIRFVPEVVAADEVDSRARKNSIPISATQRHRPVTRRLAGAAVLITITVLVLVWPRGENRGVGNAYGADAGPLVMIRAMASDEGNTGDDTGRRPLIDGINGMLGQVLDLSRTIQLRDPAFGPADLEDGDFLARQWRISPELRIVHTRLAHAGEIYQLSLELFGRDGQSRRTMIESGDSAELMRGATTWLSVQLGRGESPRAVQGWVSGDDFLTESYLRGLASLASGDINAAATYFEVCVARDPGFLLARLEMARVRYRQGRPDESLALLATLADIANHPGLAIEIASLRGDMLDTRGEFESAQRIFQGVLDANADEPHPQLAGIRYNLSYTLANMGRFQDALTQLAWLETNVPETRDPELLAHVFQRQGSLNLQVGRPGTALEKASKAVLLLERLQDRLGRAKALSLLGRIHIHQARYAEAEHYLEQALALAEAANYPLGIGATLNELIDVSLIQAKYSRAAELNQRMHAIAAQINYGAMLQAARQFSIEIERKLGRWNAAEQSLAEHMRFARASGNHRWVVRNHQLRLDYQLDRGRTDGADSLIAAVQTYIDESGERRMQAALNLQHARLMLLRGQTDAALEVIGHTRTLAREIDDREALNQAAVILASYLLDTDQAEAAVAALEADRSDLPPPHDHLRLCARAYARLGRNVEALDCVHRLRQRAFDSWTDQDEQLLARLTGDN